MGPVITPNQAPEAHPIPGLEKSVPTLAAGPRWCSSSVGQGQECGKKILLSPNPSSDRASQLWGCCPHPLVGVLWQ